MFIRAAVRRVVVSPVAAADVVQVVHGAGAHAVAHGRRAAARRVVVSPAALLGHAADGAHGLVPVVDGGQRRWLGAAAATSRLQAVVQRADFTHGVH